MKKILLVILFYLLHCYAASTAIAQGFYYGFTFESVTPPAFPAGVNIVLPTSSQDEFDTLISPNYWSFDVAGTTYTKFVVSSNGWIALIPPGVVTNPLYSAAPLNELLNNTTGFPIIAPLWDDLSSVVISYYSFNNKLWIRWASKWQSSNSIAAALVYAELDGTTGIIKFHYQNNSSYTPVNPSASIGIAGVNTGEFYSVSCPTSSSGISDSTAENNNIGTGTSMNFRPYNCTFIFTPGSSITGLNEISSDQSISAEMIDAGLLNIKVRSKSNFQGSIGILDITGKEVLKQFCQLKAGENNYLQQVDVLPRGLYLVQIRSEGFNSACKTILN